MLPKDFKLSELFEFIANYIFFWESFPLLSYVRGLVNELEQLSILLLSVEIILSVSISSNFDWAASSISSCN